MFDMAEDGLVPSSRMLSSVSSLLIGARRAAEKRALDVTVGRIPALRVMRALWTADTLTERRATE